MGGELLKRFGDVLLPGKKKKVPTSLPSGKMTKRRVEGKTKHTNLLASQEATKHHLHSGANRRAPGFLICSEQPCSR